MSETRVVKGFKVFNPDWTCRHFQYEVGQVYSMDESPRCCDRGFHFCEKAADCFQYYSFDPENKVAEVEAFGEIDTNDTKSCTNKIKIVREIPWAELLNIVNEGKSCTGLRNTGNRNTGNRNTGDWNITSFSSGVFNTEEAKILMFNKPSDWSYRDWLNSDARHLLNQIPKNVVEWVHSEDMTDEEKAEYPTHEITGGYLKILDESECGQIWWDDLSGGQKEVIRNIPNYDKEIFEQITGIKTE